MCFDLQKKRIQKREKKYINTASSSCVEENVDVRGHRSKWMGCSEVKERKQQQAQKEQRWSVL